MKSNFFSSLCTRVATASLLGAMALASFNASAQTLEESFQILRSRLRSVMKMPL